VARALRRDGGDKMSVEFKTTVVKLWANLGLTSPAFRADDEIHLNIDGVDIKLTESPDGRHILASGTAGRLSEDPTRRADQVRTILYSNLAALTSNRACAGLNPKDETSANVIVQASYPYDLLQVDRLMAVVQDVLSYVEALGTVLKDQHMPRAARVAATSEPDLGDALVFRP
jgi:hypothetical protein